MLNASYLLDSIADGTNTKVSGLLIGCVVDTSVGELSFLAAGQDTAATPAAASPDRPDPRRQTGGARILRRWSVADLIARAGGAPRAFA